MSKLKTKESPANGTQLTKEKLLSIDSINNGEYANGKKCRPDYLRVFHRVRLEWKKAGY